MSTDQDLAAAGLQLQRTGPVATITLDRPEVRNAQTPEMWRALASVGEQLADDVRVVVVRANGSAFSAGLDRSLLDPTTSGSTGESVLDLVELSDAELSSTIDAYQRGFTFLRDPRFVSVAAVHGYAIGAGFQLALACDLRVLSTDAQLSMKEAALGLVPDLTGTKPLVESVGYARALEICATARMVGADEAVRIGLALTAVPADQLDRTVADLTEALVAPPHGAVTEIKALLRGAHERDLEEQRRLEREAQGRRFREMVPLLGGR